MIMMVDDEVRRMDAYRLELQDVGYQVELYKDVDTALAALTTNLPQVQLLILDVMMAPGRAFRDMDTQDGLRTGERFYEQVRTLSADLSVIFLTNVSEPSFAKKYQGKLHCKLLRKEDYQPFELADEVRRIVGRPKP